MVRQTTQKAATRKIHCLDPNPFLQDKYLAWRRREEAERTGSTESAMFLAGQDPWGVWNTDIERYAGALGMDARRHISSKAAEANKAGLKYRMLDIGMGLGDKWLPLLKDYPNIEFFGTALDIIYVHPELMDRTKICVAFDIGKYFPRGFFDLIISHNGMHHDELPTIWEMNRLLAPKGEAIITVEVKSSQFYEKLAEAGPSLEIISAASKLGELFGRIIPPPASRTFDSYHLKKVA